MAGDGNARRRPPKAWEFNWDDAPPAPPAKRPGAAAASDLPKQPAPTADLKTTTAVVLPFQRPAKAGEAPEGTAEPAPTANPRPARARKPAQTTVTARPEPPAATSTSAPAAAASEAAQPQAPRKRPTKAWEFRWDDVPPDGPGLPDTPTVPMPPLGASEEAPAAKRPAPTRRRSHHPSRDDGQVQLALPAPEAGQPAPSGSDTSGAERARADLEAAERQAEEARLAAERQAEEARRAAEEELRRAEEARRLRESERAAAAAEARRRRDAEKAAKQAEARRKREEDEARRLREEAEAEARRLREEAEAASQRAEEEARRAEEEKVRLNDARRRREEEERRADNARRLREIEEQRAEEARRQRDEAEKAAKEAEERRVREDQARRAREEEEARRRHRPVVRHENISVQGKGGGSGRTVAVVRKERGGTLTLAALQSRAEEAVAVDADMGDDEFHRASERQMRGVREPAQAPASQATPPAMSLEQIKQHHTDDRLVAAAVRVTEMLREAAQGGSSANLAQMIKEAIQEVRRATASVEIDLAKGVMVRT